MKRVTISTLSGVALATAGIVLGLSNPASAAVIWDWSYSGGGSLGGIGTFTTTDEQPDGSFLITDITGTSENQTIISLIPPEPFFNDNLLFPNFPQLNVGGVSYVVSNGTEYLLFFTDRTYGLFGADSFRLIDFAAIARVTPPNSVPEPGSLFGYITLGSLMLGSALKKARKNSP
jgi:hypothetical protein